MNRKMYDLIAFMVILGVGGILVMGVGIVISGIFILKVKPNARFVAGWIAFTAIVYAIGMGVLMFIGCPMNDLADLQPTIGYAILFLLFIYASKSPKQCKFTSFIGQMVCK